MTVNSAADIVLHLAEHLKDMQVSLIALAKNTGVPEERLAMILRGDWEDLTIREIATVSQALDVDLVALIMGGPANV